MSARFIAAAAAAVITTGLVAAPASATPSKDVRLLGETVVPKFLYEGTTVGGLSGIDRDPRTGEYVLVSDDRSTLQPARFYTARIDVTAKGLGAVEFTGTHPFLQPDGTTYPAGAVDPEELRVDPWTGRYTWSQEGGTAPFSLDPSIRNAARDGKFVNELPLPRNLHVTDTTGPKPNEVLEGLTYAAAGTLVVSAVEGPLKQDGPSPTADKGALSRITVQTRTGHVVAQYAYPLEPIFAAPNPPTAAPGNNGISALVAADPVDPTRFLVVERAFVTGVGNKVRIYEASTLGASNVHGKDLGKARPMRKKLVADLAGTGLSRIDNIEGITWGPRLPGGEHTVILVSDDNFSASQVTQIVALAVRYPR